MNFVFPVACSFGYALIKYGKIRIGCQVGSRYLSLVSSKRTNQKANFFIELELDFDVGDENPKV
jgi:hypothetical protein